MHMLHTCVYDTYFHINIRARATCAACAARIRLIKIQNRNPPVIKETCVHICILLLRYRNIHMYTYIFVYRISENFAPRSVVGMLYAVGTRLHCCACVLAHFQQDLRSPPELQSLPWWYIIMRRNNKPPPFLKKTSTYVDNVRTCKHPNV